VVAVVNDPRQRVSILAPGVLRQDRVAATGRRLRRRLLAAVGGNKLVADLAAHGDVEDRVAGAVLSVVGDRLGSTGATAQLCARDDGYGTDHVGAGACERVRHSTAVAEARGEAKGGVDAEVRLNSLDHLVKEGDILATRVGPALVEPIRNNEDGRVVGNSLEAVVRQSTALGDILAVDNLLRTSPTLVPCEDETVRPVLVVVVRDVEDVVAVLAVDLHRVLLVRERFGLAAACRVGREDGWHRGQEEAH